MELPGLPHQKAQRNKQNIKKGLLEQKNNIWVNMGNGALVARKRNSRNTHRRYNSVTEIFVFSNFIENVNFIFN